MRRVDTGILPVEPDVLVHHERLGIDLGKQRTNIFVETPHLHPAALMLAQMKIPPSVIRKFYSIISEYIDPRPSEQCARIKS
jgi:hypothetical protein